MNPQEMSHRDDFLMGDWHVQPARLRLRGPDGTVQLEPRAMSVLLVLKDHAGQVVSRQRLHELAWADATVSDETLNRTVFDLRKVLGDRAKAPRFIETIRKVGYRLVASIEPVPPPTPTPTPSNAPARDGRLGWTVAALVAVVLSAALTAGLTTVRSTAPSVEPPRHRQLTSYPGYETYPTVTADGRHLAFAWDGGIDNVDIYWRRLDGSAPVRLTDDPSPEVAPAFSPDGSRLAFVRGTATSCRLMLIELDPSAVSASGEPPPAQEVAPCREAALSPPIWSAGGRALIFSDRDTADEPFRLHRLDLESGEILTLTAPPHGSLGDLYPSGSPSGHQVAFVRATAKSTISTYLTPAIGDLWALDLDAAAGRVDTPPRRLTDDNRVVAGLTWIGEGSELVFAARRDGRGFALWRVAASGGEPSLLSAPRGLLRFPRRAGGHGIAYERWDGRTDLWSVTLDPADVQLGRRIQRSTRSDLNPTWSPDGSRLAFTSERTGNYEIWTSRLDGSDAVQRTTFGDAPAESPAWSPDGRWIAFEANRDGRSHLYRIAASGDGEAEQLTDTPFDDRSPTWSLDGRRLYFGSNRSGSWQLWQLELDRDLARDNSRATQITRAGAFRGRESNHTDPPTLLYAKRDRGGVWQADGAGGERLVAELAPEHWGNWDVVDGVLFTVELTGGSASNGRSTRIRALDLATGEATIVGLVDGWISRETPNLAIATDRSSVLMARFTDLAADLMLVEMPRG